MEKKGFTLIELLIVIAIIGILAVAFLPSLLGAPAKGRDTQRVAAIQKINNALTNEFLAGTSYPAGPADCVTDAAPWDTLKPALGGAIPLDPQTDNDVKVGAVAPCAGSYAYYVNPGGGDVYSYGLYAHLEGGKGNIACDDNGVIADLVTLTKDEDCYAVLVQ